MALPEGAILAAAMLRFIISANLEVKLASYIHKLYGCKGTYLIITAVTA